MTDDEKLSMVKAMSEGVDTDETLLTYLKIAEKKILNRLYPFGDDKKTIPEKYEIMQCEIAVYLLNKRGAEGQTIHAENGISRSYESGDIAETLLTQITPIVGVVK